MWQLTIREGKVEWRTTAGTTSDVTPSSVIVASFFFVSVTMDVNRCWLTAVHLFHSQRSAYCVPNESFSDCKGDAYLRHIDKISHRWDETFRGLAPSKVDTTSISSDDQQLPIEPQSSKDKLNNLVASLMQRLHRMFQHFSIEN